MGLTTPTSQYKRNLHRQFYASSIDRNQPALADPLEVEPNLIDRFNASMLQLLLTIHDSTVNVQLRHNCLLALMKSLYFSPTDVLLKHLKDVPISSFIAGILEGADVGALNVAVSMAVVLMEKLPDVFAKHFVKEGVANAKRTIVVASTPTPSSHPRGRVGA